MRRRRTYSRRLSFVDSSAQLSLSKLLRDVLVMPQKATERGEEGMLCFRTLRWLRKAFRNCTQHLLEVTARLRSSDNSNGPTFATDSSSLRYIRKIATSCGNALNNRGPCVSVQLSKTKDCNWCLLCLFQSFDTTCLAEARQTSMPLSNWSEGEVAEDSQWEPATMALPPNPSPSKRCLFCPTTC